MEKTGQRKKPDPDLQMRRVLRRWVAEQLQAGSADSIDLSVTQRGVVLGASGGGLCAFSEARVAEAALFGAGLKLLNERWRFVDRDAVWIAYAEARFVEMGARDLSGLGRVGYDWLLEDTSLGRVALRVEPRALAVRLVDSGLLSKRRKRAMKRLGMNPDNGRWDARFIGDVDLDVRRTALESRLVEMKHRQLARAV